MTDFPHLFSSLELRGKLLRNRIVSTPHAAGWGRDGLIDAREVAYHVRKAAGGVGLVMTFGSASVDPTTAASYGSVSLWDERNEPALRALADGVHEHGALCMSQMTHMGRRGTSTLTGIPLRAPSDLPEGVHLEVPVPLAVSELPAIVQRFADAAARLERCGWDGCDVTSFGGHLIEQFFDPRVNTRTDEYGGSLENRTRFGREVLTAVRAAVSDEFIVSFRMAGDQCLSGGLGPDEMIAVAGSLASTGAIDVLSVSGGTGASRLSTAYFVPGDELPEGVFNDLARRFREALGIPVLVAGRNVEPAMADACVASGVDLVAMTRAIIADPDLPSKARAGRRARPCIGLNEGCIGRLYTDRPMWCSVNPGIRDPDLATLVPTDQPLNVVVVGGGVAGLEAARGAALRGHRVVLFERRPHLGGRARLAGERRGRERWARYIDWLREEARTAGAELRTGVAATAEAVLAEAPDAVIVATGSELRPAAALPGPVPVIDVDALLEDGAPEVASGLALVLDDEGGFLAPTAAERLVAAGFSVEITTTHPVVGGEIDPTQQPFVLRRLALAEVVMTPHLSGVSSDGDGVTLRHLYTERDERREGVDVVVMAGYRHALAGLRDELAAARPDLRVIVAGDALAPRTLLDAVAEGARAGAEV
ncbi:oxidoreductase [Solirubrobacter soli]|uniref:oxidoreductase n=1 Tax=Solirubrobacter soli TaxID=363832 RepID=UPI000410909C|nr:NAD(P)-binding protein [Solirubrobacter soli]